MNEIRYTSNYHWFKVLNATSNGTERLSLSEPILINERWQVIEGAARLKKAISLGKPVRYRMINGLTAEMAKFYNY